jgi:hypothetical protein
LDGGWNVTGIADDAIRDCHRISDAGRAGSATCFDEHAPIAIEIAAGKAWTANSKTGGDQNTDLHADS